MDGKQKAGLGVNIAKAYHPEEQYPFPELDIVLRRRQHRIRRDALLLAGRVRRVPDRRLDLMESTAHDKLDRTRQLGEMS